MEKYKISKNHTSVRMGEEVVLLDHQKGIYYGLNELGAFIWEHLKTGEKSVETLCSYIMNEFDIDQATCEADVKQLLYDLATEQLITKVVE